jgi:hypothetical protein
VLGVEITVVATTGQTQIDLEQIVVEQAIVEAQVVSQQIVVEAAAAAAEVGHFELGVGQQQDAVLQLQVAAPVVVLVVAAIGTHAADLATSLGIPQIGTRRKTPVIGGHGPMAEQSHHSAGNQGLLHHFAPFWTGKAIILPAGQGIPRVKS